MKRTDFRFFDRLRVRWAEVDMQRIVFNGHYLMYFDTAVAGYWRAMALPYQETLAGLAGDLFVRKATVEYLASARLDELLDVGVRCGRIGTSSLVFAIAIFRGEQCLVHGELVYVFADAATQASRPVPQALRDVLEAFEAGEPMVEVRVGGWSTLAEPADRIRQQVFVQEQGIPAEMVADGADDTGTHAVAVNRLGYPLATGRLLQYAPGIAKIGRMAVLPVVRGSRVGRAVLDALLAAARERGDHEALLHAQLSAAPFYERAGFAARGERFEVAGIPHVEMAKAL